MISKDVHSIVHPIVATTRTDQLHMVELDELGAGEGHGNPVLDGRIGLFSGVKAKVTAVVGQAQASIGVLLNLKEGAVLGLDRQVDMPIDLVVEGKVIARGQLSVMGDQFAVRVTEVVLQPSGK